MMAESHIANKGSGNKKDELAKLFKGIGFNKIKELYDEDADF